MGDIYIKSTEIRGNPVKINRNPLKNYGNLMHIRRCCVSEPNMVPMMEEWKNIKISCRSNVCSTQAGLIHHISNVIVKPRSSHWSSITVWYDFVFDLFNEPPVGIEPTTVRLRSACSANWAKEALDERNARSKPSCRCCPHTVSANKWPAQDSNLESPAPEADALSIRPTGHGQSQTSSECTSDDGSWHDIINLSNANFAFHPKADMVICSCGLMDKAPPS